MLLRQKRTLLVCLILSVILLGCGPASTPTPMVLNPSNQDPFAIPTPDGTQPVCVEISTSAESLKVGETITVTGTADGVVTPYYYGLQVKDNGADTFGMFFNLISTVQGKAADVSQILEVVSADYSPNGVVATAELKGRSAGTAELAFFVSAEIYCGISLGSGISPIITITVSP